MRIYFLSQRLCRNTSIPVNDRFDTSHDQAILSDRQLINSRVSVLHRFCFCCLFCICWSQTSTVTGCCLITRCTCWVHYSRISALSRSSDEDWLIILIRFVDISTTAVFQSFCFWISATAWGSILCQRLQLTLSSFSTSEHFHMTVPAMTVFQ